MVRLHAMTPLPFRRLCLDTRQRPPRERLRSDGLTGNWVESMWFWTALKPLNSGNQINGLASAFKGYFRHSTETCLRCLGLRRELRTRSNWLL